MNKHIVLVTLLVAGCSKKADLPPKPINGAPVAFVAGAITPGEHGTIAVKAYNFSDKRTAQYGFIMRFHDAGGAVLKVPFGTDSFKDIGFGSVSGKAFLCEPQAWCNFTLEGFEVPAKATSVEILATSIGSLKDDVHFDDKPLFDAPFAMEWPSAKSAKL